jgi:hypothetical protein
MAPPQEHHPHRPHSGRIMRHPPHWFGLHTRGSRLVEVDLVAEAEEAQPRQVVEGVVGSPQATTSAGS